MMKIELDTTVSTNHLHLERLDKPAPAPILGEFPTSCESERMRLRSCRSCAIVLSSSAILGSEAGAAIDAHDFVFRFNLAPTIGFETDVGNRTTYMVLHDRASHLSPTRPTIR